MEEKDIEKYKKAGEISVKVKAFARALIKPEMPLLEIAQKIEKKIYELGGKPAFPVNLSIDDIAAHFHPTLETKEKAEGLLKVDFGVHVDGFIADTAFSLDLTEDGKFKDLIESAEFALENSIKILSKNPTLHEIGLEIKRSIEEKGFSPIVNLSGHSIKRWEIHAGITIPNYGNGNNNKLEDGCYAIEPFSTSGEGKIYEGPSGNIFSLQDLKNVRSPMARKILDYIIEEKKKLPFSLRELQEKFGNMARIAIRELENQGIVHNYNQLIEKSHNQVAQAEHTIIKQGDKIIVTTK
jgi:methionyl aminopeptidase